MRVQIEAGKCYRCSCGQQIQVIKRYGASLWDANVGRWDDNGLCVSGGEGHRLVAEWTEVDETDIRELHPFTEVERTPEDVITSRKAPLRDGGYFVYTGAPPSFVAALKTEPMRVQILHEGARLTNGARDAEYGPPAVNMAAAGALKAAFRAHMTRDISLAELEAIDMALTKLGRIATGQKVKRDTFIDCATYIAIAGEIAIAEWAVFIGEKKGPEA